jgi:three-Cys-motif partner protein
MLLSEALKIPALKDGLVSIFNDADEKHTNTLENEINKLPNIGELKHKPKVYVGPVDGSAVDYFEKAKLIPTFSFIDPFGYKGLSWSLIGAIIKDWASECFFFFNYSRINAGVSNDKVQHHMQALFGEDNLAALQEKLKHPHVRRETVIMEHLVAAMKDAGAKFVLLFRFKNSSGKRTTHYLIFVTKHQIGYEIMKEIMATESSQFEQGVPSFEYSPAVAGLRTLFPKALDDLEDELVNKFKGRTISMKDLYHEHNVDTPYIQRNYKDALGNLERAGRIKTDKPDRRAGTFADAIRCTFPGK